jgi:hypothetical protein
MSDTVTIGEGNLIKVQIRHAGAMILQETFFVSRPGDLGRVTDAAREAAARRRGDVPPAELLAHVVSDPGTTATPAHHPK